MSKGSKRRKNQWISKQRVGKGKPKSRKRIVRENTPKPPSIKDLEEILSRLVAATREPITGELSPKEKENQNHARKH